MFHNERKDKELESVATRVMPNGQANDAASLQPNPELQGEAFNPVPQGHAADASALQPLFDEIRGHSRTRNYAMDRRKADDTSLAWLIKAQLGWKKELPIAERKRIAAQAEALIELGEAEAKGKPVEIDEPAYAEWRTVILASIAGRTPFNDVEKEATKQMEKLAAQHPMAAWVAGVRGFGLRSLAVIIAEAGDLSGYPKKGHLWKRMGLAPRDGKAYSTWRQTGGLTKKDWKDAGYSPRRRSAMFVIGDALIKQGDVYRKVYLARKEYERTKAAEAGLTVCPFAKIPKGKAAEYVSDGYIHIRAQRYMEKRLLRDLWQAWREAEKANHRVP